MVNSARVGYLPRAHSRKEVRGSAKLDAGALGPRLSAKSRSVIGVQSDVLALVDADADTKQPVWKRKAERLAEWIREEDGKGQQQAEDGTDKVSGAG